VSKSSFGKKNFASGAQGSSNFLECFHEKSTNTNCCVRKYPFQKIGGQSF